MSKQVDERVVEMRFDNKQFESATKESMSTLDKFKQKLQFKDATKGFDDIEKAAKKVNLNPLSKAAETVSMKFSAMQVSGVTAIANLTNSAVNAAKNIAKAFTIDPILTGFQEYETQINSVQTILANTESKGSTLQDVNAALNELNKYADLTIYNFTEMTRNIGTFTAAGVDLKTSVSAIKGIANLAAVSGSNAQQASTAMYQLSQALASGTVKLMDWNSVVNAGMGGQVFQDALKETARVHNIAIDDMIKKEGSFRETLQNGWLTSEILTETLSKFTGDLSAEQLKQMGYTEEQIAGIIKMGKTANDAATKVKTFTQLFDTLKEAAQSGWTKTWEILIGDFGEAKEFLTSISDSLSNIISKSADARNTMLAGGLSSGWKQLLNAGIADEEGYKETLKSVVTEHGVSIDEMIKAEQKLDESLSDTEAFQKVLRKGIAEGTLTSDMFTDSVSRMAEKMSNMSAEQLEAAGYTKDHVEQIKALSEGLNNGSISMDEFVKKMGRSSGRENLIEALWNSFNGLLSVIKPIKEAFREIFPATTGEQLYSLTERIRDFTATLKLSDEQAANLKSTFKGVFSVINVGVTIIKSIISGVATLIGKITGLSGGLLEISGSMGDWVSEMTKGIAEANIFGKVIDGVVGLLGALIDKFKEFTMAVKEKVNAPGFEWFFNLMQGIWTIIQRIGSAIGKVAAAIGGAIATAFQNGDIKSLLDILNGGLFATILLGIKKYIGGITDKFDDAVGIVDKIKEVLGSVEESLKSWQQNLQSGTIKNIAIAIGILAASLWIISGIDSNKLVSALAGIGVLMGELMGAMYLFTKITADAKKALKGLPALIGIAAAVLILASALKKISDLNWNQLAIGLTGILGLMTIIVGASKIMSKNSKKIKMGAMQMVVMASALKILASVCKDLSKLSWGSLAKGVSGITAMLLAFAGFQVLMKKIQPKKMLSSALSLVIIGAAMKLFSDACSEFGKMKWPDLGKAGAAISGILTIAAGFGKLSSYAGKIVSSSIALIMIGAAMKLFVDVVGKFGNMQWEDLGKAGAAIAGILVLASGFVLLSGLASGMIKSVAALTIMSLAMNIFADVANKFGQMDWKQLGKAGAAIGGILLLASGFALLAGLSKGMLASAAALLVMAVALRALTPVLTTLGNMSVGQIVASLITLAGGLAILIGTAALIKSFGLIPAMLSMAGAIALIGVACLAAGAGIMMFAAGFTALASAGAAGATAFVAAITVMVIGILNLIPSIIDQLTAAVVAICNVIIQSAPAIGKAVKALILTLVDVLVECVPSLTEGLLQLLIGVMASIVQYTPQIVNLLFDFIIAIINAMAARLPEYVSAIANIILTLINSLAEHVPSFVAAGVNLFGTIVQGIADAVGPILNILIKAFTNVIDSISQAFPGLASVISSCGETIKNALNGMSYVINSVFGGISNVITSVGNSIRKVLDGIAGIIESIGKSALYAGTGFENLAKGVKTITDLKLADMAASLAAVALGVGKITKNSKGLSEVGTGMRQISEGANISASIFDRMSSSITKTIASIKMLSNFIGTIKSIISNLVSIIDNAKNQILTSINYVILESVISIKRSYEEYASAGSYLVDGFVKGIKDNTFKAEARARAMADAALIAAKARLGVESPSKEFIKVGKFVVAGLANGIIKNVGTAYKASVKMANGILTSTQEALGIHSPSVVFDEKVGRYIVQGIAEGIEKDTSAEEAAKKKADNIVSAFRNELDKYDLDIATNNKLFDLWNLNEGADASEVAVIEKNINVLNYNLPLLKKKAELAYDEWKQTENEFGKASEYAQTAYNKYLDALIEADSTNSEIQAAQKSIIEKQYENKNDILDAAKSRRETDDELWELIYGTDISSEGRYKYYDSQIRKDIEDSKQQVLNAIEEYNYYLKEYGREAEVTKQALDRLKAAQIALAKDQNELIDNHKEYKEREKNALEEERQKLKDQQEVASDIADLRYQIWEKTLGRNATDNEKNTMKLTTLSDQLMAQAKLVKMAEKEWKKAKTSERQEKEKTYLSAQLKLANLQSEILDIQEKNIKRQEQAIDRQRTAQDEYSNYIKKYEKYYLDHGMTKEELEKDARLVSGYDPNNAVNSMVSKTNTALNNLKSNSQYNSLLSNFSNIGTNYATAVSEGIQNGVPTVINNTSTMVKTCANKIVSEKQLWTNAGILLVTSFINGIKSKTQLAANAAAELAARTLEAIKTAFANDGEYKPTITPVLDMSKVNSGAKRLASILTSPTSLNLARTIATYKQRGSTGNSTSSRSESPTISFTQNNYSPKALSAIEIYRQTGSMFSKFRKKVTE